MSKKSFTNNPAEAFITPQQPIISSKEETVKVIYQSPEARSKRINLLIQPTLHKELKKIADEKGTSVNNLIHEQLEMFIKERNK